MASRLMTLVKSVLALVQLFVFSIVVPIYTVAFIIFGLLNILYKLVTGNSFENIDLLLEPLMWALHQTKVLVAAEDDFRAAPYVD